ncbi:4'-phosphopantetheinyl transferase family protein [Blastococcus tunisiensis]|uniref:4'-phosphopantetheinyl transferase family protein n=1 Tax=Blastococcus tunisiensis TaxID=1798228 RepID=UPI000B868B87|nr:4'-phosphopantetheinyl transferase superfamily protein [Blastococcus sp. DSM 46838]
MRLDADDTAVARARLLLSPAELAYADRAAPVVARQRILTRAGLRRLAGDVLGLLPEAVPLREGADGRPELDVPGADVSCTRSAGVGLVAVSTGQRLGIDAEPVLDWRDEVLAEGWLSPAETRALVALPPAARGLAAARCWTRKESLLKGLGTGLTDTLADLDVGVGRFDTLVAGWRIRALLAPPGHVASIATLPDSIPAPLAAAERSTRGHAHS